MAYVQIDWYNIPSNATLQWKLSSIYLIYLKGDKVYMALILERSLLYVSFWILFKFLIFPNYATNQSSVLIAVTSFSVRPNRFGYCYSYKEFTILTVML